MPNVETWVDDRLASLEAGCDRPSDANRILARVNVRESKRRVTRSRIIVAGTLGLIACLGVAAVITLDPPKVVPPPPVVPAKISVPPTEAPPVTPATTTPVTTARAQLSKTVTVAGLVPPTLSFFKESGSPNAPVTLEVYSDYECPPCATFFSDTMPLLISEYVDTGKVKLLRRDFPLPQHKYAFLAARYANAAGMVGQYNAASEQIFRTQQEWHQDGDIDRQVAAVVSPESMQKLRELLNSNTEPAESIARDRATGADDHLRQTPGFVVVAHGKRQTFNGAVTFTALKAYLDEVLEQQ